MSLSSNLTDFARGFGFGYSINSLKSAEASVRQGHNYVQASLAQASMTATTAFTVFKTFDLVSHKSWAALGVALIPLGVGYLASRDDLPFYVQKTVYLLHDHTGNLCFVAAVTTSVALFCFGSQVWAVTSLTMLAIGVIDRNGYLPPSVHKALYCSNFVLGNGVRLFLGNPIDQFLAVVEITALLAQYAIDDVENLLETDDSLIDTPKTEITPEDLFKPNYFTFVRKHHIHEGGTPSAPNIEISKLLELVKKIDWNESNRRVLSKKLEKDERWLKRGKGQETELEYFQNNLEAFVTDVVNRKVLIGQVKDYEALERYLKHITAHVDKCFKNNREIEATDILLRLGIEGGRYCGPGRYEVAEDIYFRTLEQNEDSEIPLEDLLKIQLQAHRRNIFLDIYGAFTKELDVGIIWKILTFDDIHSYNLFASIMDPILNIGAQGASNDETTEMSPVQRIFVQKALGPLRDLFWEKYEKTLIDEVYAMSGTPRLPLPTLYIWWNKWLETQSDSDAKERFQEMLWNGELTTSDNKMKREHLIQMLRILGVLV